MPQMTFESLPHTQKAIVVQLAANVATYANENPDSFLGFQFASVLGKEKNKYFSATFLHDKDGEEVEARSILQQMKDFEKLKTDISYAGYESDDGEDEASDQDHEREKRDHHRREHTHAKSTESRALAPLNLSKFKNLADLALAVIDFEHGKHGENFYKTVAQPLLQSLRKAIKKEDEALDFLVIGADKRLKQQLSQAISDLEQAHERLKQLQTAHRALQAKQAIQEGAQQQQATELAGINAQLTQAQATVTQANQTLKAELTTTQEQLEQAQATAAEAQEKARSLGAEKDAQAAEFEHQLTLSKSETEQEREKSARLQQRLEPLEAESSHLHEENSALRAEVTKLTQAQAASQAKIDDLDHQLTQERTTSASLRKQVQAQTAELAQLHKTNADLCQQATAAKAESGDLKHSLTLVKGELAQARATQQETTAELEQAQASLREEQEKSRKLGEEKEAWTTESTQLRETNEGLKQKLDADGQTHTSTHQQLIQAQRELKQVRAALKAEKANRSQLQELLIRAMPQAMNDAKGVKGDFAKHALKEVKKGPLKKEILQDIVSRLIVNTGWFWNSTTGEELLKSIKVNKDLADELGVVVDSNTKQSDLRKQLGTPKYSGKAKKLFFNWEAIQQEHKNQEAHQPAAESPRA
ncbi:hypothetical protein [Piscirickettsia salmonis]|uniref:hypothetical protein n=1 Tax=Piscirickettsia salmonis TaxID=1238 RepID=UPI0007C91051|nr:Chromosome partition protein Smc [Piscirickettsiaceae bacterium NZ-RLO1]